MPKINKPKPIPLTIAKNGFSFYTKNFTFNAKRAIIMYYSGRRCPTFKGSVLMINDEKIQFGTIIRILFSLFPLLFGMPTVAMVLCAYNIAMTFIMIGPVNAALGALSSVLISVLFYGMFSPGTDIQGVFLGAEAVLCAAACTYAAVKRKGFFTGVYMSAAAYLVLSVANLRMLSSKAGQSIADFLTAAPLEFLKSQAEAVSAGTAVSADNITKLIDYIGKITVILLPSVLVVSSVAVGYIVMWCVASSLKRTPLSMNHSFAQLKMPKSAFFVMLAVFLLWHIGGNTAGVLGNVFAILWAMFFICAVSLVDFFLRKAIKLTFLRIIIHFVIYSVFSVLVRINPFVNIFVLYVILASVDSFVDLRRFSKGRTVNDEKEE